MTFEFVLHRPSNKDVKIEFEPENQVFDDDNIRKVKRKVLRAIYESRLSSSAVFEGLYMFSKLADGKSVPIGAEFVQKDAASNVEVDPFSGSVTTDSTQLFYFNDAMLLLNYRFQGPVYVCLAEDVLMTGDDVSNEDSALRTFFPQLYDKGVRSRADWEQRKFEFIRQTRDVVDSMPLNVDRAVHLFRTANLDSSSSSSKSTEGVEDVSLRICSYRNYNMQLDSVFGAVHASRLFPFIKYNPGLRRENMFRLYYENISNDGKKIPVLPKNTVMRLSRDIGKAQQIAIYVDLNYLVMSVDRSNAEVFTPLISELKHFYIYVEQTGDVMMQLATRRPFAMDEVHRVIKAVAATTLAALNPQLVSAGIDKVVYTNWLDANMQTTDMTYVLRKKSKKVVDLEKVPGIYAVCTIHKERSGTAPEVRMRRVENFKEMDAAQTLIVEMYAQVNAGDVEIRDIVDALNKQYRIGEEEAATMISDYLSGAKTETGEILAKPGFPLTTASHRDDSTGDQYSVFRVSGILSPYYLPAIKTYLSAIANMTQKTSASKELAQRLSALDANVKEEVEREEAEEEYVEVNPVTIKGDSRSLLMKLGIFDQEEDEEDEQGPTTMNIIPMETGWEEDDAEEEDYVKKWAQELEKNAGEKIPFVPASSGQEEELPETEEEPPKENVTMEMEQPATESTSSSGSESTSSSGSESTSSSGSESTSSSGSESTSSSSTSSSESETKPEEKGIIQSIVETFTGPSNEKEGEEEEEASNEEEEESESEEGPIMYESEAESSNENEEEEGEEESKSEKEEGTEDKGIIQSIVDTFTKPTETAESSSDKSSVDKSSSNESSSEGPIMYDSESNKSAESNDDSANIKKGGDSSSSSSGSSDSSNSSTSSSGSGSDSSSSSSGSDSSSSSSDSSSSSTSSSNSSIGNIVPDGQPLTNPNPILKRLRTRDPDLFLDKNVGKFNSYSTSCQPISRHPVILTDDEFKKTDPKSYSHSYTYGTDPGKQHHFICPRFWCFLTNKAISEADVKAGKCGGIIPKGATKIPKGAYVYQMGDKDQVPGFRDDAHPQGYCLPCCTQKNWDSKPQVALRQKCAAAMSGPQQPDFASKTANKQSVMAAKTANYIISLDTFPIEQYRWGYLPVPLQLFLDVDYAKVVDKNNPALIQPNKTVLLRRGVEQPVGRSFLGVFAEIYSAVNGRRVSVAELVDALCDAIDLDLFARAQNASLLSTFSTKNVSGTSSEVDEALLQKYANTRFAKSLDQSNASQKSYLEDSIRSHQNFLAYLRDPKSAVDHTNMWDFLSIPSSRIIPRGLNIVMLELTTQDMVERVEIVCPKSLFTSETVFDENKESVFIVKRGEFYEPIFQYDSTPANSATNNISMATFQTNTLQANIKYVLKNVAHMMRRSCAPLPSLPRIFNVKPAVPLNTIKQRAAAINDGTRVTKHVVDYESRCIGVIVESAANAKVFVPCLPAPLDENVPEDAVIYMDDDNIPIEYDAARDALKRLGPRLGVLPMYKVQEDGLIVGILTDTNQFVPTQPNENVANDGLRLFKGVNQFAADKRLATNQHEKEGEGEEDERIKGVNHIVLESYFYNAFRNKMRALFNKVANQGRKRAIIDLAANPAQIYRNKVLRAENVLREIASKHIVFVDIDESALKMVSQSCEEPEDEDAPHCVPFKDNSSTSSSDSLIKVNGQTMQLVLPKTHLITGKDNELIYFGRLADELIRNERTKRLFFESSKRFLNPSVETTVSVKPNEFIIVQSALTPEYFANMTDINRAHYLTNYHTARPSVSALYSNDPVPLTDQLTVASVIEPPTKAKDDEEEADMSEYAQGEMECVDRIIDLVGNPTTSQWRKYLPKEGAKEMVFRDAPECAAEMMAYIFRQTGQKNVTKQDIPAYLETAYLAFFNANANANATQSLVQKMAESMRKQGKSQMFEKLAKRADAATASTDFISIVKSTAYNITDMDIWILAEHYKLPIIVFNPNGLKGFGAKDIQWIKMGGELESAFFFIRSNIASIANKVYEYNLIVPRLKLSAMRDGFKTVVERAIETGSENVDSIRNRLDKIVYVLKTQLKAANGPADKKKGGSKRQINKNKKRTKRRRYGRVF